MTIILHCSSNAVYTLSASLQHGRRPAESFIINGYLGRWITTRVPWEITTDNSTQVLTCCSPIMRRNCCDAYGNLHRKWAYFASQIAMRYQLFPSLPRTGKMALLHAALFHRPPHVFTVIRFLINKHSTSHKSHISLFWLSRKK